MTEDTAPNNSNDNNNNNNNNNNYSLLLISSWIEFWFVNVAPKYLNSSTLSMELLSIFILWIRPAFWSRDTVMYLVLWAFTSNPIYTTID